MHKPMKVFGVLFVFCAFASGSFWLSAERPIKAQEQTAPPQEAEPPRRPTPLERINEKARAARNGEEHAVRELTDAVFDTIVGDDVVSRGATNELKDRVFRSEMEYRKGKRKGVQEIEVVKVINGLANKYEAPGYAKTTQSEVRGLRMSMLLTEGDFVARGKNDGKGKKKSKKGDSISSEMSPLEAVYVTADMVKQKMYNEDYQLTQEERRARWAEKHDGKVKRCEGEGCGVKPLDSPRYVEMQAVGKRASDTSLGDALDTAHRTLNILKIDR